MRIVACRDALNRHQQYSLSSLFRTVVSNAYPTVWIPQLPPLTHFTPLPRSQTFGLLLDRTRGADIQAAT